MTEVVNKLDQQILADPEGRSPDPWAEFREVEIIGLEWVQKYKHSLGKYSKFFLALEEGKFLATQCNKCGRTWSPPRPACPDCLRPTRWVELSGKGELISWSVLHYAPKMLADRLETPYVLAYVKMDGADTLFAHLLRNFGDLKDLEHGMPIEVNYAQDAVDHPIMLMWFEASNQ